MNNQYLTVARPQAYRGPTPGATPGVWTPEYDRVRNVVLKLGRGHAAYELSLLQIDEPTEVRFAPVITLSKGEISDFELTGSGEIQGWPEIGSRAFLRACGAKPYADTDGPWIQAQTSRYRYSVNLSGGVIVLILISEYLACQVAWN